MRKRTENLWTKLVAAARRARRFRRDERGVTAIEFGLLGLPFFAIIGAILETAVVFFSAQILDSAVHDSSRVIRTGQAQAAAYTAANFRTEICDRLYGMFNCPDLKVRVTTIGDFASAGTSVGSPVDSSDGSWSIGEAYDHGAGKSIVIVEAYYKWPVALDFFGFSLASLPDNTRLMGSVRVFRNEPF